jgi:hypothetical protein
MSSITITFIVLACVFGGALLGIVLRSVLPPQHLSDDTKDVVRLGMGLVVTTAALVLGLLVASAKGSYDVQSNEVTQISANVGLLDRILAHYGPEAKETRDVLRAEAILMIDRIWPKAHSQTRAIRQRRVFIRGDSAALAARGRATLDSGPGVEYRE